MCKTFDETSAVEFRGFFGHCRVELLVLAPVRAGKALDGKCSGWEVSRWLLIFHEKKSGTCQHESRSHTRFLLCMYVCMCPKAGPI